MPQRWCQLCIAFIALIMHMCLVADVCRFYFIPLSLHTHVSWPMLIWKLCVCIHVYTFKQDLINSVPEAAVAKAICTGRQVCTTKPLYTLCSYVYYRLISIHNCTMLCTMPISNKYTKSVYKSAYIHISTSNSTCCCLASSPQSNTCSTEHISLQNCN